MKPTIYIGLGGTGIYAISHVKKMYEDTFGVGNIPPQIAFVVLDYDYCVYTSQSLATPMKDDAVPLNYNGDPRDYYRAHVENGAFNWMFEGNTNSLITNKVCFVRTTGRFYTEFQRRTIEQVLQLRWQQVTNFIHGVANVDIHIVTSLCGGTGAGSFINVAEMIQRNFGNRANIIGYGVLHGIFRAMNPCPTRRPFQHLNAYSAILDLDYLMSASMDNPITFEINGAERTLTRPIFDEFFAIDNATQNGYIFVDIDELCENIGRYIYASNFVNTPQHPICNQGQFDILDKKGWVQSFGACQIVYKGEELSDIYANRYAAKLIEKMLQGSSDAHGMTMEWITNVGLEKELLINRISDISRIDRLREPNTDIQDTIDVTKDIINSYVNNLNEINREEVIASLIEEMKRQLKHKIEELLCEGKVEDGKQFLEYLRLTLKNFCYEMRAEADALTNYELARISRILNHVLNEYETYSSSLHRILFKHRSQAFFNEINDVAQKKLKIAYEIKFHEIATEALTAFIEHITAELRKVDEFTHMLFFLRDEYFIKANECMHTKENAFEYDLSAAERAGINIYNEEIDMPSFCAMLNRPLLEMDSEQAKSAIYDFAKSRPQAVEYRQKCINDIINNLNDDDYERLKNEIHKTGTLLRINNRGQKNNYGVPSELMVRECIFLCDNSRLQRDESLSFGIGGADCVFVTNGEFENLHQKMFVLRKDVAIIPYCIDSLNERLQDLYEIEVRSSMNGMCCNPHFDKTLFEEMRKKDFKLKPELP